MCFQGLTSSIWASTTSPEGWSRSPRCWSPSRLKETLRINVELASRVDFIPVPGGWEERGRFVTQLGRVAFYHFDLCAQALAKVERGHAQDLADVRTMLDRGLVDRARALEYFARIEPELYRYPALHGPSFRQAVEETFAT